MNNWKHHAYIIECNKEKIQNVIDVVSFTYVSLNNENNKASNPDQVAGKQVLNHGFENKVEVSHFSFDTCGIEESRQLVSASIKTTFNGQKERLLCVSVESITHEAQNALLKFFEEPSEGLKILLFLPNGYPILPTLRSRVEYIDEGSYERYGIIAERSENAENADNTESAKKSVNGSLPSKSNEMAVLYKKFYKDMNLKDKIKFVDDLAESVSDDKKTKSDVLSFLKEIELLIQEDIRNDVKNNFKNRKALLRKAESVMRAEEYIFDQSASVKMILEGVAIA